MVCGSLFSQQNPSTYCFLFFYICEVMLAPAVQRIDPRVSRCCGQTVCSSQVRIFPSDPCPSGMSTLTSGKFSRSECPEQHLRPTEASRNKRCLVAASRSSPGYNDIEDDRPYGKDLEICAANVGKIILQEP